MWIGLTIIFSFEKDFEKLNQMIGVYSHQSHDWPIVLFCFVFPKLLGAQICTGSQVVRILQIDLESLEQEASGLI